ncbi:hypothetical protein AAIH25_15075 [Arthrobacter crystallopoietes]|uniref:hypothetical protein n=1 Tax=Crystallibacter crystallopoietes TaxID=37928 RepID=UPI003D245362
MDALVAAAVVTAVLTAVTMPILRRQKRINAERRQLPAEHWEREERRKVSKKHDVMPDSA